MRHVTEEGRRRSFGQIGLLMGIFVSLLFAEEQMFLMLSGGALFGALVGFLCDRLFHA